MGEAVPLIKYGRSDDKHLIYNNLKCQNQWCSGAHLPSCSLNEIQSWDFQCFVCLFTFCSVENFKVWRKSKKEHSLNKLDGEPEVSYSWIYLFLMFLSFGVVKISGSDSKKAIHLWCRTPRDCRFYIEWIYTHTRTHIKIKGTMLLCRRVCITYRCGKFI